MGLLISKTDFVGLYKIAQNIYTDIDSFIAAYEEKYLIELLGADLFAAFKADINPTTKEPDTAIYQALYNEFHIDDNGRIRLSFGIKNMILGFVYFHYIREQKYKSTVTGVVVNSNENSRESAFDDNFMARKYNESIGTYTSIQWYVNENIASYPLYNGIVKGLTHWAL